MAFLLARSSALLWLRRQGQDASSLIRYGLRFHDLEADYLRIRRHKAVFESLDKPVQLLVSHREARRRSREVCSHLMQLPEGVYPSFMIERAMFCSAPELVMMEMATVLDEDELLLLGYELCGSYGFGLDGGLTDRGRIADVPTMTAFAQTCPGVHGRKRLAAVLPQVLDGAASPMEAALAVCITTSRARGGLGFPAPLLNHALPVDGQARRLWEGDTISPDLLWTFEEDDPRPYKGVAIEYDSNEHHTGATNIAHDARRRNVLEAMGYRVITVTNEQFADARELERIGMLLANYLDVPFEEATDEAWVARTAYHVKIRGIALNPERLLGT